MSRKYSERTEYAEGSARADHAEFVMRLGFAAVNTSEAIGACEGEHPAVLIGKDTRISGYMLEASLEADSPPRCGCDADRPLPTPAIAYLTRALRLQAGVVISASHPV